MKVRQYVSSVIAAAALSLAAVTGCTPSGVQIDGETVSNGDAVVSAALDLLKADNAGALRNRTSTIAESTQCFFVKAGPEVDGVTPAVACGPIRRVGLPEAAVWDVYPLKLNQDSGGRTTAHLAEDASPETGTEVAADLLVSPSGAEPAAFDAAPEPVAPQSSAKNVALVLGKDSPPVDVTSGRWASRAR